MFTSALPSAVGDASRARAGILTPSSEDALHRHHSASSPKNRKRKRIASAAMEHLLKPSIAVKPHPPNLHLAPRVLHPLMLLPRENLPLACIDFGAPNGDFPQSRFYESHIKILDLEIRMGSVPIVLIARDGSRGSTYALERLENGLYTMCKLGSWVDLGCLAKKATAIAHERLYSIKHEWRDLIGTDALTTPQMHHDQKMKRAAIEAIQSLVKKRARSQSVVTLEDVTNREQTLKSDVRVSQLPSPETKPDDDAHVAAEEKVHNAPPAPDLVAEHEPSPQQTADDIFDNIKSHYFDALYNFMGSLAYFAKGPLSRARSTFHLDLDANLDMSDLVDFLKSLILTTVQIDKKYRETIPDLISKMKDHIESSDEGRKRKRKPKKMKVGKDGLYHMEDEIILKWWNANMPEPKESETGISASQIKSHVSMLRMRETQLQMILIMEILALEPLKAAYESSESNLPALPGAMGSQEQRMAAPPQPKKRNKHNLPVLIDVHADRLTIWQSTATDEQLVFEDSQSTQRILDGIQEKKATSEPLTDFCVDVIMPFFSARLPELCDSINRKLGGPAMITPIKPRLFKRWSGLRDQKPGSIIKRPTLQNLRRPLQRALSTEQNNRRSLSRGPSNAIALLRSATSTTIPGIKRESSDSAMLRAAQPNQSQKKEPFLSRSSSMNNLPDYKAIKKAVVEAELRDAISAIRKPNRDVVGKAMVEADERQTSASLSVKSEDQKPNEESHDFNNSGEEGSKSAFFERAEHLVPPSSVGVVPLTGRRPSYKDVLQRSPSPELDTVGDTPVKSSARSSFIRRPADEEPAMPPSSPLMDRRAASCEDLFIRGSAVKPRQEYKFEHHFESPLKARAERAGLSQPPDVNQVSRKQKVSIYETLGWDDDLNDSL